MPKLLIAATALIGLLLAVPAAAQEVSVEVVTEADGSHALVHRVIVPAPPEDVWHAVATVEGWQEWAVPLARAIPGTARFETSYDASAAPGSPATIEQEWGARTEPFAVEYRTTRTPAGFPEAETYLKVASAFALKPFGDGQTELVHMSTGFAATEAGDRLLGFFTEGNKLTLEQLHERFVSGPRDWGATE
jgi:uncharacterized protein YndB with AHSA1/START domain